MDEEPDPMGQRLLRKPVRLRVGADQEPRRRAPVEARGRHRRRHRARCARPDHAPRADDDDGRHGDAHGPGLREDLASLHGQPERVRRCVRASLVQADPPRHGPDRPLPRPVGAEGGIALARPGARRRPRAGRRERRDRAEGEAARFGPVGFAVGDHRLGVGLDLPRQRQAWRRQRRAPSPRAAEGLGGQPAGRACEGAGQARGRAKRLQRCADRRQEDFARRSDRARRLRSRRSRGEEGRSRRDRAVRARPHRCHAGADRRGLIRAAAASDRRVPQLRSQRARGRCRRAAHRQGQPADTDRARDDGADRWPAIAGRERGQRQARCFHEAHRRADQRLLRQPARHEHEVAEVHRCRIRARRPQPPER